MLVKPLGGELLRGLLFVSFYLHLSFVLLAIGTAIISLFYFLGNRGDKSTGEARWDREILRTFMAHKSLAAVLGVGPLLLIQVGHSVPFFSSIGLWAPVWMALILLLIVASLAIDVLGHRIRGRRSWHLGLGIIGLASFLGVPAVFVVVLVTAENPEGWFAIIKNNFRLAGPLALHWLLRYLHILGAAIVIGAAFHYLFSKRKDSRKDSALSRWLVIGILIQFVLGPLLYLSLPRRPGAAANLFLLIGVIGAGLLLRSVYYLKNKGRAMGIKTLAPISALVLFFMLLTRQTLQDKTFLPLEREYQAKAAIYEKTLGPFRQPSVQKYQSDLDIVYDRGAVIYSRSCAFCHGDAADGDGPEAKNLAVPPENLSAVRTDRRTLHKIILAGTPGSGMPYFSFFDRSKIQGLMDYLDQKWGVLGPNEPPPGPVPQAALEQAQKIYDQTCAQCHGQDGRGSRQAQDFRPSVPDLTVYNLTPQRTFAIISNGYPGTVMSGFSAAYSEDVRWGLAKIINDKRK